MFIIMFITFGSKLDRGTFWKQFFIIPSMLLGLALLQLEFFHPAWDFFIFVFILRDVIS